MLEIADRIVLADGVVLDGDRLVDRVCSAAWPLNAAGVLVVVNDGRSLGEIAERVAMAYSLPVERARTDVLAFVWQLNRLGLANVERPRGWGRHAVGWLRLAARLLPAGALPPVTVRRRPLDTSSVLRALGSVARGLAGRCVALALAAAILGAHLGIVAGRPSLLVPGVVGAVVAAALAAHEAGHAAALRGVPSALVVRGARVSVVHAPAGPARRALVALCGPAAVAAAGGALLVLAVTLSSPVLAAAGLPAAAHVLALTVLASDGRTACGLSS
jgi:hypothetical protein